MPVMSRGFTPNAGFKVKATLYILLLALVFFQVVRFAFNKSNTSSKYQVDPSSTAKIAGGFKPNHQKGLHQYVYLTWETNISHLGKRKFIFKDALGRRYVSSLEGT